MSTTKNAQIYTACRSRDRNGLALVACSSQFEQNTLTQQRKISRPRARKRGGGGVNQQHTHSKVRWLQQHWHHTQHLASTNTVHTKHVGRSPFCEGEEAGVAEAQGDILCVEDLLLPLPSSRLLRRIAISSTRKHHAMKRRSGRQRLTVQGANGAARRGRVLTRAEERREEEGGRGGTGVDRGGGD